MNNKQRREHKELLLRAIERAKMNVEWWEARLETFKKAKP